MCTPSCDWYSLQVPNEVAKNAVRQPPILSGCNAYNTPAALYGDYVLLVVSIVA